MAKLKLDLDQLAVETFDTADRRAKKGTVFGGQCTCWSYCAQETCAGYDTCDASCAESCGGSCYNTECHTCETCNPTIANGLPCCL
jgi:hypothetical protein